MFYYWFPGGRKQEKYEKLEDEEETVTYNDAGEKLVCGPISVEEEPEKQTTYYKSQRMFITVIYFGLILSYFVTAGVGIGLVWLYSADENSPAGVYAKGLGIISAMIIIIQWTPQIFRTIIDRSAGNFSILMIGIMTPASFIILFYFAVLSGQNWTTWIPYLFSGIQQAILLFLCIFFEIRNKLMKKNLDASETQKLTKNEKSEESIY
jgi:uncharacterized protein with PQ loop repeat